MRSNNYVLAIDPGNIKSAFVVIDLDSYSPILFEKAQNEEIMGWLDVYLLNGGVRVVIEMVASYGMPVGATVFDTCVWIGRFAEYCRSKNVTCDTISRRDVKNNLCHCSNAKDGNIIQALIDRFAPNTQNRGKGTKKNPGWFYGFRSDIWQAYALGVTYIDREKEDKN